jgi:hypothetical protein
MKRKTLFGIATLFLFTVGLWAADASGKWSGQVPGRNGQMREVTFVLKASGESLTGTMSGRNGDVPIADGKVSGDDISFSVTLDFGGNSVTQKYAGKIAGNEIKFKREGGQGQPIEFVAKRSGD